MKNFSSVSTNAARFQDISLNPQKLAGMCAKLKCCLNYEVDSYVEASRKLPGKEIILQTQDSDYYYFKADALSGQVTYSTDKNLAANLETITAARANEIIGLNRQGEKPLTLLADGKQKVQKKSVDLLANADISRFDKSKQNRKKDNTRRNKRKAEGEKLTGGEQKDGNRKPNNRPRENGESATGNRRPDSGRQTRNNGNPNRRNNNANRDQKTDTQPRNTE